MSDPQKTNRTGGGCGFLVFACAATCAMLLVNGALVSLAHPGLAKICEKLASIVPLLSASRLSQILMLGLPVALIFAEWWLIDFVVDHVARRRSKA